MAKLEEKEWTLMLYCASDTQLAPEIVSQLKAIKQAGFHPDVNVIAQFDPSVENADTHIFDINRINKIQAGGESKIGFIGFKANDPFIVNLMTDKLWRKDATEGPIRERIIDYLKKSLAEKKRTVAVKDEELDLPAPPAPRTKQQSDMSSEPSPEESLAGFLRFCSENYPARHYILFILGHGLAVGNDTFLFDEHAPEHFLKLQPLGELLDGFRKDIKTGNPDAEFELVSFHSCSMSSVEVAFELQGVANYMLASQSPSFVGSFPYRQILIRIFNHVERKKGASRADIKELLTDIYSYCVYNTIDFLVAGYSCDGCLCDLNKVDELAGPVSDLSKALIEGLQSADPKVKKFVRERILLAHLDAQSYFRENYCDQFDFCFRLQQRIEQETEKPTTKELQAIFDACQGVMEVLTKGLKGDDDRLIVRSDFVGAAYQYSHGLSVYFPWLRPLKSAFESKFWPDEYEKYKFSTTLKNAGKTRWSDFLRTYFDETRRQTRLGEFTKVREFLAAAAHGSHAHATEAGRRLAVLKNEEKPNGAGRLQADLLESFAAMVFNNGGQLGKPDPDNSQGEGCGCQTIKNYPLFTRDPEQKKAEDGKNAHVHISPALLSDTEAFKQGEGELTFVLDSLIP